MTQTWTLSMKESFMADWRALPSNVVLQIQEKLDFLIKDPLPDAKTKKQLKHIDSRLYRIRSGDYRIFYTIDRPYVSVLGIRRRDEDTYDRAPAVQFLGGLDDDVPVEQPESARPATPDPGKASGTSMPDDFGSEFLNRLRVPQRYHDRILAARAPHDVLAVSGVPDEYLLRVEEALVDRPLVETLQQKEFVAHGTDDLIRFKEGELLGFLLRLDPEQERFVTWAVGGSGPTLVKGAAGTGKSTVALYRVKAYLEAMRKSGESQPRILFTTYTNALVTFSKQLLGSLLRSDANLVDVRTADAVAREIVKGQGQLQRFASMKDVRQAVETAMQGARFEGDSLAVRRQQDLLRRLGVSYLQEEFLTVIQARRLETFDEYRQARRSGRRVPLNGDQRRAVWAAYEAFDEFMDRARCFTWQKFRAIAADLVASGDRAGTYDAVIVDEAQDLDPSLIQMLVGLCRSPASLFLTADANQSIYGSGFRWKDVHDSLRFRGRTGLLKINHRSTREISEAARSYLRGGELDTDDDGPEYAHAGPLPAMRRVADNTAEVELLSRFLPVAARQVRLGRGACAVLVPTEREGERIARQLQGAGLDSSFMTGADLDFSATCVKVLTLKSSKGLEFPVVAVAGFFDERWPPIKPEMPEEQQQERLAQERRTLYVAMTRAMRALLVISPAQRVMPLLAPFDRSLWNTGTES